MWRIITAAPYAAHVKPEVMVHACSPQLREDRMGYLGPGSINQLFSQTINPPQKEVTYIL